jgi:hypothetical protein
MDATTKEGTRLAISFFASLSIGLIAYMLITFVSIGYISKGLAYSLLILLAYLIASGTNFIFQYASCNTVNPANIFLSCIIVLRNISLTCLVLYLDTYPFFAVPSSEGSECQEIGQRKGIEFFSGIVKAILPEGMSDTTKTGIVHVYWTFWMTLLPIYFLVGVNGICSATPQPAQ